MTAKREREEEPEESNKSKKIEELPEFYYQEPERDEKKIYYYIVTSFLEYENSTGDEKSKFKLIEIKEKTVDHICLFKNASKFNPNNWEIFQNIFFLRGNELTENFYESVVKINSNFMSDKGEIINIDKTASFEEDKDVRAGDYILRCTNQSDVNILKIPDSYKTSEKKIEDFRGEIGKFKDKYEDCCEIIVETSRKESSTLEDWLNFEKEELRTTKIPKIRNSGRKIITEILKHGFNHERTVEYETEGDESSENEEEENNDE